jgi:hypothetical protein
MDVRERAGAGAGAGFPGDEAGDLAKARQGREEPLIESRTAS